jgi:DNA-directed RNA polymerase specialized sigma24 family protein
MYKSSDLIDDAILKLYEGGYNIDDESLAVKLKLFSIVDRDLDTLFKNEAFHQKTISTSTILEEELDGLEEAFSVDADLDLIMNEDFDDISYAQDQKHKHLFIYSDNNNSLLNTFELQDISLKKSQKVIGYFYSWLPTQIADVVDLYVFGKLSFEDIAKIKQMEVTRIERIFKAIKKSLRKNLD